MTKPLQVFSVSDVTDQVVAAATETVVAALPAFSTDAEGRMAALSGTIVGTGVAGTTGATIRIRRTGLTGALVGEAVVDSRAFVGAVTAALALGAREGLPEVSGMVYVLTLEPAGGQITKLQAQLQAVIS